MMGAGSVPSASSVAVQLSQFPGEAPAIEEVISYLDENEPLIDSVFGFELRGEVAPQLIHLSKQDDLTGINLVTGSDATTASGMKHNLMVMQVRMANATRKESYEAAVLERKNSLAQWPSRPPCG